MEIKKEDACQALIHGKIVIAYFGNNGDYKYNHLATPVEIRLFDNLFCTYPTEKTNMRKLTGKNIKNALFKRFEILNIHPVCILDERPIREPMRNR